MHGAFFIMVFQKVDTTIKIFIRSGAQIKSDLFRRTIMREQIIKFFIVGKVETKLLQISFFIPINFGHENKSGMLLFYFLNRFRPEFFSHVYVKYIAFHAWIPLAADLIS